MIPPTLVLYVRMSDSIELYWIWIEKVVRLKFSPNRINVWLIKLCSVLNVRMDFSTLKSLNHQILTFSPTLNISIKTLVKLCPILTQIANNSIIMEFVNYVEMVSS